MLPAGGGGELDFMPVCVCMCFSNISGHSSAVWKEPFTPVTEGKQTLTATLTHRNIKVTPRFTPPGLTC